MLVLNSIEREGEIAGFARVIKPRGAIRLAATPAKDQEVGPPPAPRGLSKKTGDVVRPDRSLESV